MRAYASFVQQRVGALTFAADAVFFFRRDQLIALAARHAIPTMYPPRIHRSWRSDELRSQYFDAYRLTGNYAGRVLKGEKTADLPVQQAVTIEFILNLITARRSALKCPRPPCSAPTR
jgi:putative ABC transport system substrate-binding protein